MQEPIGIAVSMRAYVAQKYALVGVLRDSRHGLMDFCTMLGIPPSA